MLIRFLLICSAALLFFGNLVYPQTEDSATVPPEVKIAGTQVLHIHSSIVGRDYDLYINLPRDYNDTAKTFPVLYVLDGQWDFPLVMSIFGQQYFDGFIPGIVVVGVTWGGDNPNYDSLRARDFTPTDLNQPERFGNAPKFLQFLKKELIPYIESKYRVKKDDRTLMGSSLGGLFTLYTLFTDTSLFEKYVPTSPAITWDNGVIYKFEENYAKNNKKLPARLFMDIGSYENVGVLKKFEDKIKSRNYGGLDLQTKVIEGMGHSGEKSEGFSRGMQFVYARPSVEIAPATLEQYAGEYQLAPGAVMKLAVEDKHLVAYPPDNSKIILHAENNKKFYVKGFYGIATFEKDDNGKVTGFDFEQYTGHSFVKKIND